MPTEKELSEKYKNERLDRLEAHYKKLDTKLDDIMKMVEKTNLTLIGSDLKGSGVIQLVNTHNEEIMTLKTTVQRLNDYIKILAWFSSVIGTAVIVFLVNYILK